MKGIGANDATLLEHEIFYRGFRNRRELASWVGLTPTPWSSGDTQRDQGIGRDGPAWIRALLIQMAWRWLRYQPDSALSKWFEERTATARAAGRTGSFRLGRVNALQQSPDTGVGKDGAGEKLVRHCNLSQLIHRHRDKPPGELLCKIAGGHPTRSLE